MSVLKNLEVRHQAKFYCFYYTKRCFQIFSCGNLLWSCCEIQTDLLINVSFIRTPAKVWFTSIPTPMAVLPLRIILYVYLVYLGKGNGLRWAVAPPFELSRSKPRFPWLTWFCWYSHASCYLFHSKWKNDYKMPPLWALILV